MSGFHCNNRLGFIDEKLGRAKEHIDAFERAHDAFFQPYTHTLEPELDTNTGEYALHIRNLKSIPMLWSLLIGDALHNMRSALDALTYGISVKALPSITNAQVNKLQFPICDNFGMFNGEWCKRLPHLDVTVRAAFESLQPYSGPPLPLEHPLKRLRDLHNIDKHRHLVLAFVYLQSGSVGFTHPAIPGGSLGVRMRSGVVQENTVVARYTLPAGVRHADVQMGAGFGLDVVFKHGGPAKGEQVKAFLQRTYYYIRDTAFPTLRSYV